MKSSCREGQTSCSCVLAIFDGINVRRLCTLHTQAGMLFTASKERRTYCGKSIILAVGLRDLHVLACSGANISRDLASQDVLHEELGGVIGWGRGVHGHHISCCARACSETISSFIYTRIVRTYWAPALQVRCSHRWLGHRIICWAWF